MRFDEHARLHCEELFNVLLKEISAFSANHQFADDVCLVGHGSG